MKLHVVSNYAELSKEAAKLIAQQVAAKPQLSLMPATGNTPVGTYEELAKLHGAGLLDSSELRLFQLDDYLGLAQGDERALFGWMDRALVQPLAIPSARVFRLPVYEDDHIAACRQFDETVASNGGLDIALLGLGPNGHLGFNEPPCDGESPTRVITLSAASIASSAGYWGSVERVPLEGMTFGMAGLLSAKLIVVLVSGKHKRDILRRVLRGKVTPDIPASYLHVAQNVLIIADRDACPRQPRGLNNVKVM